MCCRLTDCFNRVFKYVIVITREWFALLDAPVVLDHSMEVAREANEKFSKIKEETEALIATANKEQGRIVREAMLEREKIIDDARKQAETVAQKELDEVRKQIQQEKEEAIRAIRRQVAELSVDIAEKVIRKNLDEEREQMDMIDRMLDEMLPASKKN